MADHAVRRFRLQTGLRLDAHRTALPIRWCTWWGVVTTDGLFVNNFDQIGALAQRYSVPAMFQFREFAAAGGLMSYGPSFGELFRQSGILAGRTGGLPNQRQVPAVARSDLLPGDIQSQHCDLRHSPSRSDLTEKEAGGKHHRFPARQS